MIDTDAELARERARAVAAEARCDQALAVIDDLTEAVTIQGRISVAYATELAQLRRNVVNALEHPTTVEGLRAAVLEALRQAPVPEPERPE